MEGRIGYCYSNPDEEINTGKSVCMTGVQAETRMTEVHNTLTRVLLTQLSDYQLFKWTSLRTVS